MYRNRPQPSLRQGLLATFLGVACVSAPALAAPPQLPPLVAPASHEHHVGKPIFFELITPDLAATKQFYANLFGWTFRDVTAGGSEYAEASLDGRPVAELIHRDIPAGEHRQPAWLTFIAVRDVYAAKNAALLNGGRMLVEPHTITNLGKAAVFADPQGAVFAILASDSGDPPDVLAEPGEWIWSSLITRDPDTDAAFYQSVFDYEVFDLPPDPGGAQHFMLATDDYSRASANTLSVNRPNAHPHWLNYVRVDDADASIAKLVAAGGRVLVEPRIDRHGGKIAVVADPVGTPFGLMEWPDTESKQVAQ